MRERGGENSDPLPHSATTARAASEEGVIETGRYEGAESLFEEVNILIHSAIDIDQSILTELENVEEGNLLDSTGEPGAWPSRQRRNQEGEGQGCEEWGDTAQSPEEAQAGAGREMMGSMIKSEMQTAWFGM